jgi:hypothetical protein
VQPVKPPRPASSSSVAPSSSASLFGDSTESTEVGVGEKPKDPVTSKVDKASLFGEESSAGLFDDPTAPVVSQVKKSSPPPLPAAPASVSKQANAVAAVSDLAAVDYSKVQIKDKNKKATNDVQAPPPAVAQGIGYGAVDLSKQLSDSNSTG